MKRKILGAIAAIIMGIGAVQVPVGAVSGSSVEGTVTGVGALIKLNANEVLDSSCEKRFLGLRPWYGGLAVKYTDPTTSVVNCRVGTPDNMPAYVWTIILNILADLFSATGILAMVYIIYGGFRYIMSQGEPGKMAGAKTTISRAMVGIAISVLAAVITNALIAILKSAVS